MHKNNRNPGILATSATFAQIQPSAGLALIHAPSNKLSGGQVPNESTEGRREKAPPAEHRSPKGD